jgi:restriction endonuclease
MTGNVMRVQDVLESFDKAANGNEQKLATVHSRMEDLEMVASDMFDRLVQSGLAPHDSVMVEKAQRQARLVETARQQDIAFAVGPAGTGKTYVYLRTIHELYARYGFTKFIIVVPSVAIREASVTGWVS